MRPVSALHLGPAVVAALLTAPLAAQTLQAEYSLPGPFGTIGDAVSGTPDLDGDGLNDVLVAGKLGVFSYSSATYAELGFHPLADGILPRRVLGLPDMDGDGQPDLLVGISGELRLLSRADGSTLWSVTGDGLSFPDNVELSDDVNGDGLPDLVTGDVQAMPGGLVRAGSAYVLDGATGAELLRLDGTASFQDFGYDVAALSDVDADGHPEIAVVYGDYEEAGQSKARIQVFDALDGGLVHDVVLAPPAFSTSINLVANGDMDADGVEDLAVSYILDDVFEFELSALSGASGGVIWTLDPFTVSRLVSVGDVDGDGVSDLMAGSASFSQFSVGFAVIMSGADGTDIAGLSGGSATDFSALAAVGDVTGDGLADVLTSGPDNPLYLAQGAGFLRDPQDGAFLAAFTNDPGGDELGRDVTFVADRTGDGERDVVLLGLDDMRVFDGQSGAAVASLPLPNPGSPPFSAGPVSVLELSDLDGDGVRELFYAQVSLLPIFTTLGSIQIVSGADGSALHTVDDPQAEGLGWRVGLAHDENGDGVRDLWVSAYGRDGAFANSGAVDLRSGADLSVLRTISGPEVADAWFGQSVAVNGDFDLDGVPDVTIGSREGVGGRVAVFSGATGNMLLSVDGTAANDEDLRGLLAGDVDADGTLDLFVAERDWATSVEPEGRVRMLSGVDGSLLWERVGSAPNARLGREYAAVGDVNGDGHPDVAVDTILADGVHALVLSGLDGTTLDDLPLGFQSGVVLRPGGLYDAGGCTELLVGVPSLAGNGGAQLSSSSAGGNWGLVDLGLGLAGSDPVAPRLAVHGDLQGGGLKTLSVRGALPGAVTAWFLSVGRADVPFKGGTLVPSPFVAFFAGVFAADPQGEVLVVDSPTPLGIPQGFSLFHQFAFQDPLAPAGVSLSNGLQEIFKGD